MKPSTLKPGQRVQINPATNAYSTLHGTFIRREPRKPGRPAYSVIRVDEFVGLNGPTDLGEVPYSDYAAARRFQVMES